MAQHVTLDWGTPKVHLASGEHRLMRHALADPGSYVEVALCGYVQAEQPREGAEDEVDAENICARCLIKRHYSSTQQIQPPETLGDG